MSEDKDIEEALEKLRNDDRVTFNEDGTKTVRLEYPVKYNNKDIEELTFRRPRGADWRNTDREDGGIGKAFMMAAALTGYPLSVFDNMDGEDALVCSAVAGTMGKKSKIGGTS